MRAIDAEGVGLCVTHLLLLDLGVVVQLPTVAWAAGVGEARHVPVWDRRARANETRTVYEGVRPRLSVNMGDETWASL